MIKVDEIGAGIYRISAYVAEFDLQFNHFLLTDDEPMLYHSGLRGMFEEIREGVASVIDPSKLRWVGFSHFESDECGSLNRWLEIAPQARPVCSQVGALVSVNDYAIREPRGMADGEVLETGERRYRLCRTPHLPHGWDAAVMYEESSKTLLCSDLFHQSGQVEPITESDIVGRSGRAMREYQAGVLADYSPYTHYTEASFKKLADISPETLAVMHGSSFRGNARQALFDLAAEYKTVFGTPR
ncbi:MAG TPA: MBL fold metallo-hydrolase [Acidobacteriota bacterium]|nr:MBL fold metallo-hydrolase [Acidobacteriota bacterium]